MRCINVLVTDLALRRLIVMRRINFALFLILVVLTLDLINFDFVNLFSQYPTHQHVYTSKAEFPKLIFFDYMIINAVIMSLVLQLYRFLIYYINTFRYVHFSNNLSTLSKKSELQHPTLTTCATRFNNPFKSYICFSVADWSCFSN